MHLRFLDLVRRASATEATDAAAALRLAEEALAAWRSDPLPELTEDPVGAAVRDDLRRSRTAVTEVLLRTRAALGRAAGTADLAELLVSWEPLGEPAWLLRLQALRAEGRRAEALLAYARLRRCLVEELGTEPGPELRRLHEELLAEDRETVTVGWPSRRPRPGPGDRGSDCRARSRGVRRRSPGGS